MDLQDGGLQGTDIMNKCIVHRIDAIESQAETYHVVMGTRETFNPCRIADVPQDFMGECRLQLGRSLGKDFILLTGEVVKLW